MTTIAIINHYWWCGAGSFEFKFQQVSRSAEWCCWTTNADHLRARDVHSHEWPFARRERKKKEEKTENKSSRQA